MLAQPRASREWHNHVVPKGSGCHFVSREALVGGDAAACPEIPGLFSSDGHKMTPNDC